MTVEEVRARVAEIRALDGDYEAQHSAEDCLHSDVLRAIAKGEVQDPCAVARAALATEALAFPRHCA